MVDYRSTTKKFDGGQHGALACGVKGSPKCLLGGLALLSLVYCCSSAVNAADIKIGLIYEARPADQPWSASINAAAEKLAKENPSIKLLQSYNAFDPTAAEPVARQMLSQGVAFLDFHSFALSDVAHTLAKEFPKVPMSLSTFLPPQQPNLNIATASYLQIGYSNCWLLAKISKSSKIAFVGAQPIPYATELLEGCKLGAEAAKPGTEVLAAYSNSFDNQQATREQAQSLIDRGADTLFPASATQDSLGGFQLCEQKKIPCAGWASDIRRYAPKYGVVSAIVDWSVFLKDLLAKSKQAEMKAETFNGTFKNGGLITQPFQPSDTEIVSKDLQAQYASLVKDIADGKITFPKSKAHPCCE
jgi:basic membrane lipoprotein Med (substrate-binding protein (PBP1-ABC) superfamily)